MCFSINLYPEGNLTKSAVCANTLESSITYIVNYTQRVITCINNTIPNNEKRYFKIVKEYTVLKLYVILILVRL